MNRWTQVKTLPSLSRTYVVDETDFAALFVFFAQYCRETGICSRFLCGVRSGCAEVRVLHEGDSRISAPVSTGSGLHGQK